MKIKFDSSKAIGELNRSGISVAKAEQITRTILDISKDQAIQKQTIYVNQNEAITDDFAYKIALADLKAELGTLRKTETAALQAQTQSITRDLDLMNLKWREDFNTVKSDIQLDLNTRKAEIKEEHARNETRIQEISHKAMLKAGDLRTASEQMKLELLTTWSTGIVLAVTGVAVVVVKLIF